MVLERSYEAINEDVRLARNGQHHYPFSEDVYEDLAREKYERGTSQRESNRRRANLKRTSSPQQDRYSRNDVWEKCGGVCYLCNLPMVKNWRPSNRRLCFTVEHIVPLSKGGTDTFDNVNGAHMECNLRKGSK